MILQPAILDQLVGDLKSSSHNDNTHQLIVGAKGSGRSSLLHQLADEVGKDPILKARYLPLSIITQPLHLLDVADILQQIQQRLTDSLLDAGMLELAQATQRAIEATAQLDETKPVIELTEQLMQTIVTVGGRQILLFIEEFQQLLDNGDDRFAQTLEQSLLHNACLSVCATSTPPPSRQSRLKTALLGRFTTFELPRLNQQQCSQLWQYHHSNKTDSLRNIRPWQILSQGNPKILSIAANLCQDEPLSTLHQQLAQVLDVFDDYYSLHLSVIAPTERKVYLTLLELWTPSTTRQIADKAGMALKMVSALLGRLCGKGLLLEQPGPGKAKIYRPADPLLCLHYRYKRYGMADDALAGLLDFMVTFYGRNHWDDALKLEAPGAETLQAVSLTQVLWSAETSVEAIRSELADSGVEGLDIDKPLNAIAASFARQTLEDLTQTAEQLQTAETAEASSLLQCIVLDLKATAMFELDRSKAEQHYRALIEGFNEDDNRLVQLLVAQASLNLGVCLEQQKRYDEASKCYSDAINTAVGSTHPQIPLLKARALFAKGLLNARQQMPASAVNVLAKLSNDYGEHGDEAIQVEVARAYLAQGLIWLSLSQAGHAVKSLTRLTQSLSSSPAVEVRECVAQGYLVLSHAAQSMQQTDRALSYLQPLIEYKAQTQQTSRKMRNVIADAWLWRSILLLKAGRVEQVMDTLRETFHATSTQGKLNEATLALLLHLAADSHRIEAIIDILASDDKLLAACRPVVVALGNRLGKTQPLSAQLQALAEDVLTHIPAGA